MKHLRNRLIIFFVLILAACQPVTYQAAPTNPSEIPTPTENNLDEPIVPSPTAININLQEELKNIWQPALSSGLIMYAVCPMMTDTASRQQADLITDEAAYGELFTEGLLLSGVKAAFAEWNPNDPIVTRYKDGLQNRLAALLAVVDQWSEQEITAAEALKDLETQCLHVENYLGNMVKSAQQAGMTQETLDQILAEFQDNMSEMMITE
ncbi:MAG: hypothetical protein CL609_17580 [Anaerolineaceae bacterium]|nr:hypothetical protein [Anaerolineaceae bacterium]